MSFRRSQLLPTFCRSHSHPSWLTPPRRSIIVLCPCGAQQRAVLGEVFLCNGCGDQNRAPTAYGLLNWENQQRSRLKRDRRNRGRVVAFGTITTMIFTKGFGFIQRPNGAEVYFNCWSMPVEEFHQLIEGQEVRFSLHKGRGQNGKKPRAIHVEPLRMPRIERSKSPAVMSCKANATKRRKKAHKAAQTVPDEPKHGLPRPATSEQVAKMILLKVRECDAWRCTFDEANETIATLEKANMTAAPRATTLIAPPLINSRSVNGSYKVPKGLLEVRHAYVDEDKKGWWLTTKRGIPITGPFTTKAEAEQFWRSFQESRGRKAEALSNGAPKRQAAAIVSRAAKRTPMRENKPSQSVWTLRPMGAKKPGSHASARHR